MKDEMIAISEQIFELISTNQLLKLQSLLAKHQVDLTRLKLRTELNAMQVAAQFDRPEMMNYLETRGLMLEENTKSGDTLAHLAARYGAISVLKYLEKNKQNFMRLNKSGHTPLHIAAIANQKKVLQFFKYKISWTLQDKDGSSVKILAEKAGHLRLAEYIEHRLKKESVLWDQLKTAILNKDIISLKNLQPITKNFCVRDNAGCSAIHIAAAFGLVEIVAYLKNEQIDLSIRDDCGATPLLKAACWGHLNVLTYLLDSQHVDLRQSDEEGWMALHWAAQGGHLHLVEYLCARSLHLSITTQNGQTALHIAAFAGHLPIVAYLHEQQKADLNAIDQDGLTPLHWAARGGHLSVVKYLNKRGANLTALDKEHWAPLHLAAEKGYFFLVKYLHRKGVNLIAPDKQNWTALHLAAKNGHLPIVKYLSEHSSNLAATTNNGETAIHMAIFSGHLDIVVYLCNQKIDLNIVTKGGRSLLHWAVANGHLDIVKHLLELGAHLSVVDQAGRTVLHWAAMHGHLPIVTYLCKQGIDLIAIDEKGWTAFHCAAFCGHLDIITYLHQRGGKALLTTITTDHLMAHHLASVNGYLPIVKYLSDQGVNLAISAEDDWTLLHGAAYSGNCALLGYLLSQGLNLHAISEKDGYTAAHVAASSAKIEALTYLKTQGLNLELLDTDGWRPIHVVASLSNTEALATMIHLTSQHISLEPTLHGRLSLPHLSAICGHLALMQYYDTQKLSLALSDSSGLLPLHLACANEHEELKLYLLSHRDYQEYLKQLPRLHYLAAFEQETSLLEYLEQVPETDINEKDSFGNTALHLAVCCGNTITVNLLLKRGATAVINQKNKYGFTPLHMVAVRTPEKTAYSLLVLTQCLLDEGAHLEAKDLYGNTPLVLALNSDYSRNSICFDVLETLLTAGADLSVRGAFRLTSREKMLKDIKYDNNHKASLLYQKALHQRELFQFEQKRSQSEQFPDENPLKIGSIKQMQELQQTLSEIDTTIALDSDSEKTTLTRNKSLHSKYLIHSVNSYIQQEWRKETQDKIEHYPNLTEFYHTLTGKLEEVIIAYKAIASGCITFQSDEFSSLIKGIQFFGFLVSLAPIIDVSPLIEFATDKTQEIADERLFVMAKRVSRLANLQTMLAEVEHFALELTVRYQSQLLSLQTSEQLTKKKPIKSHTSKISKLLGKMRTGITSMLLDEKNQLSPAQQVAEYAAFLVLEALKKQINTPPIVNKALSIQFLEAVLASETDVPKKIKSMTKGSLSTSISADQMELFSFFYRPGVSTYDGVYFVAEHTNPSIYGYRFAKPEELTSGIWRRQVAPAPHIVLEPVIPWIDTEKSKAHELMQALNTMRRETGKTDHLIETKESSIEAAARTEIEVDKLTKLIQQQLTILLSGITMQNLTITPLEHNAGPAKAAAAEEPCAAAVASQVMFFQPKPTNPKTPALAFQKDHEQYSSALQS